MPPRSELTTSQRDVLQTAVREGYFEVPRRISLVEVAEQHDISSREASEQLRRSIDSLLRVAPIDRG